MNSIPHRSWFLMQPPSDLHGVGHTARVMAWACVLARDTEWFNPVLWAAACHDLRREDDGADPNHGFRAGLGCVSSFLAYLMRKQASWSPGIDAGRKTVAGIDFGIEICADHAFGILEQEKPNIQEEQRPQIHLICSAAVQVETPKLLVRPGGYVMHASSSATYTSIRRLDGGRPIDLTPDGSPDVFSLGAGKLKVAVIEIDF